MKTIALTGDVMLGRLVDESVIQNRVVPPTAVWGDVLPRMLAADLRMVNLECVISARGQEWEPVTKTFHFRASPRAIESLQAARIDGVTLANNHILDYGHDALVDCLGLLDQARIAHTGAGVELRQALAPALVQAPGLTVALIGITDNEPEWEATERRPGISFVSYGSGGLLEPYRARLTLAIREAKRRAPLVVVGAHVGPNWGAPSQAMRAFAHDVLDLGADCYWGHSNHTPQGIELYRGRPILYSSGDFIDDYAVDANERNDLSFLFLLDLEQDKVARIRLVPTAIEDCRVRLAKGPERSFLERTMQRKCAAFGTPLRFRGGEGTLSIRPPS